MLSFSTLSFSFAKFSCTNLLIRSFICFWNSSVTFFITFTRASVLLFLSKSLNSSNLLTSNLLVLSILTSISSTSERKIWLNFFSSSFISSNVPTFPRSASAISPRTSSILLFSDSMLVKDWAMFLWEATCSPWIRAKRDSVESTLVCFSSFFFSISKSCV